MRTADCNNTPEPKRHISQREISPEKSLKYKSDKTFSQKISHSPGLKLCSQKNFTPKAGDKKRAQKLSHTCVWNSLKKGVSLQIAEEVLKRIIRQIITQPIYILKKSFSSSISKARVHEDKSIGFLSFPKTVY